MYFKLYKIKEKNFNKRIYHPSVKKEKEAEKKNIFFIFIETELFTEVEWLMFLTEF